MLNLYVVGCGGIGGYLIDMLPMAISSLSLDILQKEGVDISFYLSNAGRVAVPSVVDRVVLIDGDTFNPRNAIRQGAGAGLKLVQRLRRMRDDMINVTYLQNVKYRGHNEYVNPGNISQIIPTAYSEPNQANETLMTNVLPTWKTKNTTWAKSTPVVFLCVDNAKTRYEVSVYMEQFKNCLVLNGGNDKTTGHVTAYEKRDGVALDPTLYDIYPDINPDVDKRPDEECTQVAPQHDQIAITNSMIANIMVDMFDIWAREPNGLTRTLKRRGQEYSVRYNEVLLDMEAYTMSPLSNTIDKKEEEQ